MSDWAVIVAGGSGTRFWPASAGGQPKQFLPLAGAAPLLRQAFDRVANVVGAERVVVVTGRPYADRTAQLLPELPGENLLAEPRPAGTAPALMWATVEVSRRDAAATLVSTHADWYVSEGPEFAATVQLALGAARDHDSLVTVGIPPTRPDPGFGYIVPGASLGGGVFRVNRFVEKPSESVAGDLIEKGAVWNSGLFTWTAERFVEEARVHSPELWSAHDRLVAGKIDEYFAEVTPIVVDKSHYERSERVALVSATFTWDDVGTWAALLRVSGPEADRFVKGPAFIHDSARAVVWNEGDEPVVVDGIEDVVVVRANGRILVTTGERSQRIKDLLANLPPQIKED